VYYFSGEEEKALEMRVILEKLKLKKGTRVGN
jgi:hypothetical protein